jgi:hypothetical protein
MVSLQTACSAVSSSTAQLLTVFDAFVLQGSLCCSSRELLATPALCTPGRQQMTRQQLATVPSQVAHQRQAPSC